MLTEKIAGGLCPDIGGWVRYGYRYEKYKASLEYTGCLMINETEAKYVLIIFQKILENGMSHVLGPLPPDMKEQIVAIHAAGILKGKSEDVTVYTQAKVSRIYRRSPSWTPPLLLSCFLWFTGLF